MNIDASLIAGVPIQIVSKYDDGDQIRRHRKRRINKKWLKRYGVYHTHLKAGEVIVFEGRCLMSLPTYRKVKKAIENLEGAQQ